MLRTQDKRLFLGQQLSVLLGGSSAGAPPVEGYVALWDATVASSITVTGSGVSQWSDLSGNGNHLTQTTDGSRPPYTGTINGVTVPDFDGSADHLVSSLDGSDATSTMFVVAMVDTLAQYNTIKGSSDSGGLHWVVDQTAGTLTVNREGLLALSTQSNASVSASTAFVAALRADDDANTNKSWIGTTSEEDGGITHGLTAGRTFVMGRPYFGTQLFNGKIAEMIVYDTPLGDSEVLEVINHLKNKWAV